MKPYRLHLLILLLAATLSGCGVAYVMTKASQEYHVPLDPGETKPAPYLIAHIEFRPNVEQGKLVLVEAMKYSVIGVVSFIATADLKPIDWEKEEGGGVSKVVSAFGTAFFGTGVDWSRTFFAMRKDGVSVVPMPAGTVYIRRANFLVRSFCQASSAAAPIGGGISQMQCTDYVQDEIKMYRDIKLDVPPDATAVYIGKLVLEHNGSLVSKVTVVDDYAKAMAALSKQPIAGIDPKKVIKRLAVVQAKR